MTEPDYSRLATAVLNARYAAGLSQAQVAAGGGPSDTTLAAIEASEWRSGRPGPTLSKLDAGLGWPRGTASALLAGYDVDTTVPRRQASARPTAASADREVPAPARAAIRRELVERDLVEAEYQLERLTEQVALLRRQYLELTSVLHGESIPGLVDPEDVLAAIPPPDDLDDPNDMEPR